MGIQQRRKVNILLVEDNSGDVILTKEAFSEINFSDNIYVVTDGEDALDFLYQRGKFEQAPTPDLILLDLNLPRRDGREVLQEIKKHPKFHRIPVIILTTSKSDKDVKYCFANHANSYITKPIDYAEFVNIIKGIDEFWLKTCNLPLS